MSAFLVEDLGVMGYTDCLLIQRRVLEEVVNGHRQDSLLLVEHPPVITLGANFHPENLLNSADFYTAQGIDVVASDRGGDVTYHAPGQLVAYPIFGLEAKAKDLHKWLRQIEEAVIIALSCFGLSATRLQPHTGVWVDDRKICALGIKVRRWVSMHGLALNCDNDLTPFGWIVPCGIADLGVTSLTQELGRRTTVEEARTPLIEGFRAVFG